MRKDDRRDTLEEVRNAWRDAAFGLSDRAQQHMDDALELLQNLERPGRSASVRTVRNYIQAAQHAVTGSDSLGAVLALVAAQQALEEQA